MKDEPETFEGEIIDDPTERFELPSVQEVLGSIRVFGQTVDKLAGAAEDFVKRVKKLVK